jgi:lipopolysaccharide export system protein LptA
MISFGAFRIGMRYAAFAMVLAVASAEAAPTAAGKPAQSSSPIQILPGSNSKEPISIDADKLVYFDKEQKAIYSGNVIVVQGDTKMTCSVMTVYLDRSPAPGAGAPVEGAPGSAAPAGTPQQTSRDSGIRRLEATGPVTVISKTQVATGDDGIYDKVQDKVFLVGHVTMSDGQNVTKGDKLTYDLKSGQATIDNNGKPGRVHGQFTPNNDAGQAKPK